MENGWTNYLTERESILFLIHLITMVNSVKVHYKERENSKVKKVRIIRDNGITIECMDKVYTTILMVINMKVIDK